ncbi:MAG: WD40 repeat domain-containing protein, partial [Candidatus Poribacteria bacterium]|nr:WD40 repeat domain-containing protein [Candidatus Poribacteria bacterium]
MKIRRDILFILLFALTLFSLSLFAQDYNRWQLPEGAKLRIGKGRVHDIKYTPDGKRVAVATSIGIWIYDAHTHEELALLTGHTSWVTAIDFPADGRFLASVGFDGTVRLWNIDIGEQTAVFPGPRSGVQDIAVSPNGKTLVSSSWETLILWDIETGKMRKHHTKYDGVGLGQRIKDSFSRFLQPRRVRRLKNANDTNPNVINALAFSPDGKTFVSGHWDGVVRIWDGETGQRLLTLRDHKREHLKSLAFSPDGKTFVSGAWPHSIQLHTFQKDKPQARPLPSVAYPSNLEFSPDGTMLFGTGRLIHSDHTGKKDFVHVWEVDTGRLMMSAPTPYGDRVIALASSPDGDTILTGGWDGTVHSWDTKTLKYSKFSLGHTRFHGRKLLFSDDGKTVRYWKDKDHIQSWDIDTGTLLTGKQNDEAIKQVIHPQLSRSPDGKIYLEFYAKRTKIRLLDVASDKHISDIAGHKDIIRAWAFSPDSKTLATASEDRTIQLWEVATGKQIMSLRTNTNITYAVAFSPDGKILVGGSVY